MIVICKNKDCEFFDTNHCIKNSIRIDELGKCITYTIKDKSSEEMQEICEELANVKEGE